MSSRVLVLSVLVAFALTACGEEPEAAPAPITPRKKQAVAAPVEAAVQVDYVYSSLNKRDPFRGFSEPGPKAVTNQGTPTEGPECTEPLCLVDLDELNVVAVVSGDANPLAMVEDRTGVGHIVRRNTRMGKQGGKVVQILRDCIVVLSFVSGGADGKPQPNKQNLCVRFDKTQTSPLDLLRNKEFVP
jgi:type IV pilus assembly protein PilP